MAKPVQALLAVETGPDSRSLSQIAVAVEPNIEDLVHAWRRLGDPTLRHLAIRLVRTLAQDDRRDA